MAGRGALLVLACALVATGGVTGSTGESAAGRGGGFLFDKVRKHATISVLDSGRVAAKQEGEDYQTVLLRPEAPRGEKSFVEFSIDKQAAHQCFVAFGVTDGEHDYVGDGVDGRSALAAQGSWMLSTHSGKHYHDGGQPEQYLPGEGTVPFFPGDDAKKLGSVRPREGDKVGLLLDRSPGLGTLSVFVNGVDHGVMARVPEDKPLCFAADLSDAGQRVLLQRPLRLRGGCGAGGECLAELLIKGLCANEMTSMELWDMHALLKDKSEAEQADAADLVRVNVSIPASSEEPWVNIHIVGSWNDWLSVHPLALALDTMKWEVELLVPKGKHLFKLLKGGEWCLTSAYPTESDAFPSPGNNVLEVDGSSEAGTDAGKKAELLLRDGKAAEASMRAIARLAKVREEEEERDKEAKVKEGGMDLETAQQRADSMLEEAKKELAAVVGSMVASDSIKVTVESADGRHSEEMTVILEDTIGYALTLAGAEDGDFVEVSGQKIVVNKTAEHEPLERTLRSCGVRDGDVLKLQRETIWVTVVGVDVEGGEKQVEVGYGDDVADIILRAGHDPAKVWLDWAGEVLGNAGGDGLDDEGVQLRAGQTVGEAGLANGDVVEICSRKPKRLMKSVAKGAQRLAIKAVKRTVVVGLGGCVAGGALSLGVKSGLNLTKIDGEMVRQVAREIKDVGTWSFAAGRAIGARGLSMLRKLGCWGVVGCRELGKGGIAVGCQVAKVVPPALNLVAGTVVGGVALGGEMLEKMTNDTRASLQAQPPLPKTSAGGGGKDGKAVSGKPEGKDSKDGRKAPPWQRSKKPAENGPSDKKQGGWKQPRGRKEAAKESPKAAEKSSDGKKRGWLEPRGSKPAVQEPSQPATKDAGDGKKGGWFQLRKSKPAEPSHPATKDAADGKKRGRMQSRSRTAVLNEPPRADKQHTGGGKKKFFLQRMGEKADYPPDKKQPDGKGRGFGWGK